MAPNRLSIFTPSRWFSRRDPNRRTRPSCYEHHDTPVPGIYHYIPGRGTYLVVRDDDPRNPLNPPIPVVSSSILGRYIFCEDFADRKVFGTYERLISNPDPGKPSRASSFTTLSSLGAGNPMPGPKPRRKKVVEAYFFRLDDGYYVRAYDEDDCFLSPSVEDKYKIVSVGPDLLPRFRRLRPVNNPTAVGRADALGTVPEGNPIDPATGLGLPSASGPATAPIRVPGSGAPDQETHLMGGSLGVTSNTSPMIADLVMDQVHQSHDAAPMQKMSPGQAALARSVSLPNMASLPAFVPTLVETENTPKKRTESSTTSTTTRQSLSGTTCRQSSASTIQTTQGTATPVSVKGGSRTPMRRGMMMLPNMSELRRKLEALTSRRGDSRISVRA